MRSPQEGLVLSMLNWFSMSGQFEEVPYRDQKIIVPLEQHEFIKVLSTESAGLDTLYNYTLGDMHIAHGILSKGESHF